MSLALGTILAGRYRILARLGEGGMGSVYQAEDLGRSGRMWAIKELLRDAQTPPDEWEAAVKRFEAEFDLMRRLSHPRIPRAEDLFVEGQRYYFVMDFIAGQNLEQRLEQARAPLPEQDVVRWAIQVCEVLTYVHAQRPPVILRDLKPGNIMITPAGDVRVIDFGIARTFKLGKHSNTENLGTLIYASPEHLGQSAQTDTRSDVYSLGATLYHVLTNHEPTPMETPIPGALRRLNRALSEDSERIVIHAMRIKPAERYQTAAQMSGDLHASLLHLRQPSLVVQPAANGAANGAHPPHATASPAANGKSMPPTPVSSTAPHLSSVHGGIVCPQCGHINRMGARYCSRDGVALPLPGIAAQVYRTPLPAAPATGSAVAGPARKQVATGQSVAPLPAVAAAGPSLPSTAVPLLRRTTAAATADVQQQRALDAYASGRYAQAAHLLEAAIASGRDTYDARLLLARTYQRLDRTAQAVAHLQQASRLRPTTEVFHELGLAERRTGHMAEAQAALTRARQLSPRDANIAYQLGVTCLDLNQLAQAEGELEAVLMLQPDHVASLLALAQVRVRRGQVDDAIALLQRAVAIDPQSAEVTLQLGRALMSAHRLDEAARSLEKATRLAPASAESQVALAMCYHALDKRRQAKRALDRATRLDPHNADARQLLSQL